MIPAYLRRLSDGRITRSDLARELDRSEKVAVSYALGQAMTSIFSTHVLKVRYLMHIDRYGGAYNLAVDPRTKRRADLFGQLESGSWVVAEAKGRSTPIDYSTTRKMRLQKRTVRSIAGVPPEIAYGCCAYFEEVNGLERLCLYAVDPEEDEPEAVELRVGGSDSFVAAYYAPFLAALDIGERVGGERGDYVTASFGPLRVQVSVLRSVVERVRAAQRGLLRGLRDDLQALLPPSPRWESTPGHFADGTSVVTKWSDALAQEDWGGIEDRWWGDGRR
ncbi:hypothetical protein [Streptomyces sp. NPDC046332]|uniref:hypothetical protein n=1 Tax=Streptomyces sp. NPDC046332 TaxID=3155133 RepID=UPI0033D52D5B